MMRAALRLTLLLALAGCGDSPTQPGGVDAGQDAGFAGSGGAGDSGGAGTRADAGHDAAVSGSDAAVQDSGGDAAVAPPPGKQNPWIAFVQLSGAGFGELAFVKADGTGLRAFEGAFHETDPTWSPDGSKLAFVQYEPGVGNSLHVLELATGEDRSVSSEFFRLSRPRFSPDGQVIVVAGTNADVGVVSLFRVDVASGDSTLIATAVEGDGGHDLAADGSLFFVRKYGGGKYDVFRVPYDAEPSVTPTQVTTDSGVLGGVTVHTDGARILYSRQAGSNTELVELTLSDLSERVIGHAGDEAAQPFVDGQRLVLSRESFGANPEIVVTDQDGKLIQRCTDDTIADTAPAPSPLESDAIDLSMF
jgi:dipeptidyl aminopeptidase/acylaminoacyl peptidase